MIKSLVAAASALALACAASLAVAQSAPADKRASSEPARQTPVQAGKQTAGKGGALAKQDEQYFRDMAQANMAEVQAGRLAQQRAVSESVKEFAGHMVKDHSRMLEEQRDMAKAKAVQMPEQVKKEHQQAMNKLQQAKGPQFDAAYMAQMVKDHERTLQLVQKAAKDARDPQLQQMAQKAAPQIEEHLKQARDIHDRAAAGATASGPKGK